MIPSMMPSDPIYTEVQPYRELPPFTLLTVIGALFGWFLIIWVGLMSRPLGSLQMPNWLAWVIGLCFGVIVPIAYTRMKMVTVVYPDRLLINNGVSGRNVFLFDDIVEVELRNDNINEDYNVRNIGSVSATHIAYTVLSTNGVQLVLVDGRHYLIGSKEPQALADAIRSVWRKGVQARLPEEFETS